MTEHRIHVKTGLMVVAVLVMVAMIVGAVSLEAVGQIDMDMRTTLILTGGGIGLTGIFAAPLWVSRHRWTLLDRGLEVRRSAWLLPPGWYPGTVIPYAEIAAMDRLYHNAREGTRLTLRDGGRVWLQVPVDSALSAALRGRVTAARGTPLIPGEAAGFWASWPGLTVIALAFVLSVGVAYGAVSAVWTGYTPGSTSGSKGVTALILLPLGVILIARAALARRREVRGKRT